MNHIKQRWAETHLSEWPDPTHERHCAHKQPEAAHAASELDEWEPMPARERWAVWAVLLGVPAAVIVLGIVVALV